MIVENKLAYASWQRITAAALPCMRELVEISLSGDADRDRHINKTGLVVQESPGDLLGKQDFQTDGYAAYP